MHRLAAVCLLVGVVLASATTPAHAADPQFTLTAGYQGLYPDARVAVPVTVHNPQSFPIEVSTASATVGDARSDCPSRYVSVTTFAGRVRVPAYGTSIVPMQFHMLASAPDACQGAVFPLTFRASGAPASDSAGSGAGGFAFTGSGAGTVALVAGGAAAVTSGALLVSRRRGSSR